MTAIHINNSGSDISVDSWTLLDHNLPTEEQNLIELSDSTDDIVKLQSEVVNEDKESDNEEKKSSDGFLTFDEFLQERLLEHDYEIAEKPQKSKKTSKNKNKNGARKCKAQNLGISVFITIILALTAFATLCSTLSQPLIEKELEAAARIDTSIKANVIKPDDDIFKKINETLRELEEINPLKLLSEFENEFKNSTLEQCPKKAGPKPKPTAEIPKPKQTEEISPKAKLPKCETPRNILKTNRNKPKSTKSTWMILKELFFDTNLHALVSLIMTNIYLFTLLADLSRRPVRENCQSKCQLKRQLLEDLERNDNFEDLKKFLFKELPFSDEEFLEKDQKRKKATKACNTVKSNVLRKPDLAVLNENRSFDKIVFRSCPFLARKSSIFPLIPVSSEAFGKSECQRRFEELDLHQKKFDNLKQTQKSKIKLLKQKFKNEVSYIRDTEEESEVRAEKINRTSQRFIKKLKYNREKYLMELKKVKELRQKLDETKSKDVDTGTYSVSLPPIYDYGEKFMTIKEKFEGENGKLPKEWKFQ